MLIKIHKLTDGNQESWILRSDGFFDKFELFDENGVPIDSPNSSVEFYNNDPTARRVPMEMIPGPFSWSIREVESTRLRSSAKVPGYDWLFDTIYPYAPGMKVLPDNLSLERLEHTLKLPDSTGMNIPYYYLEERGYVKKGTDDEFSSHYEWGYTEYAGMPSTRINLLSIAVCRDYISFKDSDLCTPPEDLDLCFLDRFRYVVFLTNPFLKTRLDGLDSKHLTEIKFSTDRYYEYPQLIGYHSIGCKNEKS